MDLPLRGDGLVGVVLLLLVGGVLAGEVLVGGLGGVLLLLESRGKSLEELAKDELTLVMVCCSCSTMCCLSPWRPCWRGARRRPRWCAAAPRIKRELTKLEVIC